MNGSILFSFEIRKRKEGEGLDAPASFLARSTGGKAFTPTVILFIALPAAEDNSTPEGMPIAWLPRHCPLCRENSIIGHGKRRKQAHDADHDWIWIRRGLCCRCEKSFTILPLWSLPYTHYSLHCREHACRNCQNLGSAEQSAPTLRDPDRVPDGSTIRRWLRCIESWRACLRLALRHEFCLPTIRAWNWPSLTAMVALEAKSP